MRRRMYLLGMLICLAGCSSAPQELLLLPVEGAIEFQGQAMTSGTVSLHPLKTKTQHQPTGMIEGGRYRVFTVGRPGAPPGKYKVTVFASEQADLTGRGHANLPKSLIPARYNQRETTPLTLEVREKKPQEGVYDLQLE